MRAYGTANVDGRFVLPMISGSIWTMLTKIPLQSLTGCWRLRKPSTILKKRCLSLPPRKKLVVLSLALIRDAGFASSMESQRCLAFEPLAASDPLTGERTLY